MKIVHVIYSVSGVTRKRMKRLNRPLQQENNLKL